MAATLTADVIQDDLALSLAWVLAAANKRARELGIDVWQSFITISQDSDNNLCWRINYGPKDYVGRRGGDLIVEVDARDATIKKVLYGQ
ncbi:MAG: hypothetical protein AB1791_17125 [Chloroflexota bacterium]